MDHARLRTLGFRFLATLGVGSALLLTACGSDGDSNDGTESTASETSQQVKSGSTGSTGKQGKKNREVTPGKKAPESAGDRKKAPDDVISNRPGSKVKPVSP